LGVKGESKKATCSGLLVNDINVDRGLFADVESKLNRSLKLRRQLTNVFLESGTLQHSYYHDIIAGKKVSAVISTEQYSMGKLQEAHIVSVYDGISCTTSIYQTNHTMNNIKQSLCGTIFNADKLSAIEKYSSYKLPPRVDINKNGYWEDAINIRHAINSSFEEGIPIIKASETYFENAVTPILLRPENPIVINPEIPPHELSLNFINLWLSDSTLDFLRIELDALIIMNEITVYHVQGDGTKTAIHPVNASLDFDIDSQVWSFSGQLLGKGSLDYLGYRSTYEINVNGHELMFTLREYARASSFANDAYSFVSVTNTQWLFSPYVDLYSDSIEQPKGAWQIVDDVLANESFTLDKSILTPEWTLAADSFSYLNKPAIEIIMQIANACGAIIQPDKTQNIIHAQPRYKVSPWDWPSLLNEECDHVINADYVITESSTDNTTTEINNVLISGETHGVITNAVKAGTAGDVRGTDVVSALSQDNNVNAELARNIMSDSGQQEIIGLNLPLLTPNSDYGLLLPGEIVRVIYENKTLTGLCLSNNIAIQTLTDVSQSVKLEINNGYS